MAARSRVLALALVLGSYVVVAVAIYFSFQPAGLTDEEANCSAGQAEFDVLKVNVRDTALVPRPAEALSFEGRFGTQRRQKAKTLVYDWTTATPPKLDLKQLPQDIEDQVIASERPATLQQGDTLGLLWDAPVRVDPDDDAPFPSDYMGIFAKIVEDGVAVEICVGATGAAPGRYTTAIQFEDPSIASAPIPLTLVVKENDVRKPVLSVISGIFLAAVLILLRWQSANTDGKAPLASSVAVGGVLAVLAVASAAVASWSSDPTWGDSFTDPFALFVTTTLGIVGSAALGEAAPGIGVAAAALSRGSHPGGGAEAANKPDEEEGEGKSQSMSGATS